MQVILHQLGELFLQAVPTVLIVLVFFVVMRALFFRPLLKVMAERDARTAGARKAAEQAQAAASEKVKQYQEALKQARAKVYAEQEAARKTLLEERANLLKTSRGKASAEVAAAKERLGKEFEAARRDMETAAGPLSEEIARRILETAKNPVPVSEAR
jgi:F-type H+-transporting ATPase subunit b